MYMILFISPFAVICQETSLFPAKNTAPGCIANIVDIMIDFPKTSSEFLVGSILI